MQPRHPPLSKDAPHVFESIIPQLSKNDRLHGRIYLYRDYHYRDEKIAEVKSLTCREDDSEHPVWDQSCSIGRGLSFCTVVLVPCQSGQPRGTSQSLLGLCHVRSLWVCLNILTIQGQPLPGVCILQLGMGMPEVKM